MKLYYVYPFQCPHTNQLIDNYELLKNKYLSNGRYADYWNSCLRIICRKYGLSIGCSFNKHFEELIKLDDLDSKFSSKFSNLVSQLFRPSLSYKKIFCNAEISRDEKKIQFERMNNNFISDILNLLQVRKDLCVEHDVSIFPDIKRVNYHPAIAGEMWEGGHLINEESVYLHLINEVHSDKIKR